MFHDTVVLWNLRTLDLDELSFETSEVVHALSNRDGRTQLIFLSGQTELRRRDLFGSRPETIDAGVNPVTALDFGYVNGVQVAATARVDGTVTLRELPGGRLMAGPYLLPNAAQTMALSDTGNWAICHDTDIIVLQLGG